MKRCRGDMLEHKRNHPNDIYCVTTNSFIRQDGELVMGRGIAKSVRDTCPGLAAAAGQLVLSGCGHLGEYNLLAVQDNFTLFQVKYSYKDDADAGLIARSAESLSTLAHLHPDKTFHLNFPGIGNGRLSPTVVLPLLKCLPDNVKVWQF